MFGFGGTNQKSLQVQINLDLQYTQISFILRVMKKHKRKIQSFLGIAILH
jgi:hypothetical protein